jgi:RHS repeat-associated protein
MNDDALNTGDYVDYTYDQWNRLLTETRHISQDSFPVTYQYDVASRVTQMTYPDSMQILYTYDDLNRITQIKRYVDGQNDEILFDNPQYDVESLLTQFDYGNDIQTTYTYDSRDRPLTIDVKDGATSLLDLDYTYDDNNNITQLINGWRDTNSSWHSETESYSYDGLDRLTSASCTSWAHTYTYDKAGNRTGKDAITYTINAVNEVTTLSDGTSFTYDDNGNRIQKTKGDETWNYIYDYANKLTKVEENDSTIGEYVYYGDGKRLQKIENNITTTYISSGINTIYEENSTGTASYVYGPTGLIAKRTTINQESNTYFYHKDHLGSTRSVTDSNKIIIAASTYHPFGETEVEEGSEHYHYTGKEKDSTGLYYYGARYYDPEIGRFITRDLIVGRKSNSQSLNLYTYCLNNPVNLIDPAGLEAGVIYCEGTGDNRVCFEFTANGWRATKGEGKNAVEVTNSKEITELMNSDDPADQARAVYLMLLITHPEIQGDPSQIGENFEGGYLYYGVINGEEIELWITISNELFSEEGQSATVGLRGHMRDDGIYVEILKITVYQDTFQSINHLYHVIGHEGVHVYEYITFGITFESNAFKWNLSHVLYPFPYPYNPLVLLSTYQNLSGIGHPHLPI